MFAFRAEIIRIKFGVRSVKATAMMYVRQGREVLVGTMMASGAGLDLLNIGDDGV